MSLDQGRWARIAGRFWAKVEKAEGCWLWRGARSANGYGNVRVGSQRDGTRGNARAHRVAFELAGGDPAAEVIMHSCDNRQCVNPAHLVGGTAQENARDCINKGRGNRRHLDDERAAAVRTAVATGGRRADVAACFGISHSQVTRIVKGVCWKPDA